MQSDWAVQLLPGEEVVWDGTSRPGIHPAAVVDIELAEHRNGTGTITFGPSINPFLRRGGRTGSRPPAFEFIDDYAHVMQLAYRPPARSPQ